MIPCGSKRVLGTILAACSFALTLSGCLPLLLGSARTLKPGEFSVAVAGMERTHRLAAATGTTKRNPGAIEQAGPSAGIIEIRGGLPGDRMDSGLTVQIPWNGVWDLKMLALRESAYLPAVAVQGWLGLLSQPTFGGALLATKKVGPVEITGMGGMGRSRELLWPAGEGYWSDESDLYVKQTYIWGAGIEYQLLRGFSLLTSVVSWHNFDERVVERGTTTVAYEVNEGPTYFFSAGVRYRWSVSRPKPHGILTALRGYVLSEITDGAIVVGRPGVYRATVLIDSRTEVLKDGSPVELDELIHGRAVLIQGLTLPQPSTFLARTIELQN